MQDEANTAKTLTIQGLEFDVNQPYVEGHKASEAEAKALNQTRSENIRNNMASKVKAALKLAGTTETIVTAEDGTESVKHVQNELSDEALLELVEAVAKYDDEYEFTLASVGGGKASRDPIEVEATKIARSSITDALRKQGRTLKSVTHDADGNEVEGGKEALAAAIAKTAAREDVIKAAKKIVADRAKTATADLTELAL